jgi:hypothetical protein
MGLKPVRAPDPLHPADGDADRLSHGRARPMRRFAGRGVHCPGNDAFGAAGIEWRDPRRPRLVTQQTLKALGREAFLPTPVAGLGLAGLAHDGVRTEALNGQQHNPGPRDVLPSLTTARSRPRSAAVTVKEITVRMQQDSHAASLPRTRRDSNVRFIH